MKFFILAIIFLFSNFYSFSQYFVPFGADSLWVINSDSSYIGAVNTMKVIDTNLYVGGYGGFNYGGQELLNSTGFWDTNQWHSLNGGTGLGFSITINDIIKYNNCIYFANGSGAGAGSVTNSGFLSGWNGSYWLSNPEQINFDVNALAVRNDTLFFGGGFHSIGTEPLSYMNVAAFNGTEFLKIGSLPSTCLSMATFKGDVYAGGVWGTLKKYVGGTGYEAWEDVASMGEHIMSLDVDTFNNLMYISAQPSINTIQVNGIGIYDGFKFSNMGGTGTEYRAVIEMTEYRGEFYARDGNWDFIKWDDVNKTWLNNPIGIKMAVADLAVYDDMLYIGGTGQTPYWGCMDSTDYGIARYYIPEDSISACAYLKPRVQSYTDTFNVNQTAQLYNNNAYADSWYWDFGDTGTSNIKDPSHVFTQTGTYTVSVTVTHGTCTKTATKDITVVLGAGIKETQEKDSGFKIYPNPSKKLLFLEIKDEKLRIQNCEILDINGKTVYSSSLRGGTTKQSLTDSHEQSSRYDAISIDISILQNGVYFVKIGEVSQLFVKG